MHFLFVTQLLIMIVGPLVKMVLRVLGFGFVSYVGFNLVIDQARSYLVAHMGQLGAEVSGILGLANFDILVNMYFAAIATRFMLAGVDKATDRRRNQVWRKPGGTSIEA